MGFADICNLGLALGIGPQKNCMKTDHPELRQKKKQQNQDLLKCNTENKLHPSLSLGPPADDEAHQLAVKKAESADFHSQASSDPSAVSSFSNSSSIKRERDQFVGDEADHELEVEKFPSRNISDLDEDGNPRKKLRLTKEQSALLEDSFKEHSTLNPKQKQELAVKLKLRARQVEVWFQNRRARTKLKQTEVDCELLKKCCETLTEENERLQKELHELKSMKTTPAPLFMQLPAATLTICPSCERICSGATAGNGNGPSATAPFFIGSKVHNFHGSNYSFTHPSAAC